MFLHLAPLSALRIEYSLWPSVCMVHGRMSPARGPSPTKSIHRCPPAPLHAIPLFVWYRWGYASPGDSRRKECARGTPLACFLFYCSSKVGILVRFGVSMLKHCALSAPRNCSETLPLPASALMLVQRVLLSISIYACCSASYRSLLFLISVPMMAIDPRLPLRGFRVIIC